MGINRIILQGSDQAKLYAIIKQGDKILRKPRIHFEGALQHVIVRGNNKSYIFKEEQDKLEYLERVKNIKKNIEVAQNVKYQLIPEEVKTNATPMKKMKRKV